MTHFPMAVAILTFFEGDISLIEDKPFGFFDLKVESIYQLNEPILQLRSKINKVTRIIAPLGTWSGTLFFR
jgi:DNA polymerase family B